MSTLMTGRRALKIVAAAASAFAAVVDTSHAQRESALGLLGSEILIAEPRPSQRLSGSRPAALTPDGELVVTWEGEGRLVTAKFSPSGERLAQAEFGTRHSQRPSIAVNARGSALLAWEESPEGERRGTIRVQEPPFMTGAPRLAATIASGHRFLSHPDLWAGPDDFVAVWRQSGATDEEIAGRRLQPDGTPVGEVLVIGRGSTPSIAGATDGSFLIAWIAPDARAVIAHNFSSKGIVLGPDIRLTSLTRMRYDAPSVAIDAGGEAVVLWRSISPESVEREITARRINRKRELYGSAIILARTRADSAPRVVTLENGSFVAVWERLDAVDGRREIILQHFSPAGQALADPIVVNRPGDRSNRNPTVLWKQGRGVVLWQSESPDGAAAHILARPIGFSPTGAPATVSESGLVPACAQYPVSGCARAGRSILHWENPKDPRKRTLLWKWLKGTASFDVSLEPKVYDFCVYDDARLVAQLTTTATGRKLVRPSASGITRMVLKGSKKPGGASAIIKGRGERLPAPLPFVQSSAVRVQLVKRSPNPPECWESTLTRPSRVNTARKFRDRDE